MGLLSGGLAEGEQLTYRTRLHWVAMSRQLLWALCCDAATVGVYAFVRWLRLSYGVASLDAASMLIEALLLLLGFGFAMYALWGRNATTIFVTNQRVLVRQGLFKTRTIEIAYRRIESIVVEQSAMGRMLDFGDIRLCGVGGTNENFARIDRPHLLRRVVEERMEAADARKA